MKLQRLWRPAHPVFWLMVIFNVLSSACAWLLRSVALPPALMGVIALVALGNVAGGLWCAWWLLQALPSASSAPAVPPAPAPAPQNENEKL